MPVKNTLSTQEILISSLKAEMLGEFKDIREQIESISDSIDNTSSSATKQKQIAGNPQQSKKTPAQIQQENLYNKRRVDTYNYLNKLFTQLVDSLRKNNVELVKFYKYIKQNNISLESFADKFKASNLVSLDEFMQSLKSQEGLGKESKPLDLTLMGNKVTSVISDKLKAIKTVKDDTKTALSKISDATKVLLGTKKVETAETPKKESTVKVKKKQSKDELAPKTSLEVLQASLLILRQIEENTKKLSLYKPIEEKKQPEPKLPLKELSNFEKVIKTSKLFLGIKEPHPKYNEKGEVIPPEPSLLSRMNPFTLMQQAKDIFNPPKHEEKTAVKPKEKKEKSLVGSSSLEVLRLSLETLQRIDISSNALYNRVDMRFDEEDDNRAEKYSDELQFRRQLFEHIDGVRSDKKSEAAPSKPEKKSTGGIFSKLSDLFKGLPGIFSGKLKTVLVPLMAKLSGVISSLSATIAPLLVPIMAIAAGIAGAIAFAVSTKKFIEMIQAKKEEKKSEISLREQAKSQSSDYLNKLKELGKSDTEIAEIEKIQDEVQRKNKAKIELTKSYLAKLEEVGIDKSKIDEIKSLKDSQSQLLQSKKLYEESIKSKLEKVELPSKVEKVPEQSKKLVKEASEEVKREEESGLVELINKLVDVNINNNQSMDKNMKELIDATKNSKAQLTTQYIIPDQNIPSVLIPVLSL